MATARKAAKKKSKRTVMYSSGGKKLYAVRDASGKFKDIQQYSRAHAMDIKRGSTAEVKEAAAKSARKVAKKAQATEKAVAQKVGRGTTATRSVAAKVVSRLKSALKKVTG